MKQIDNYKKYCFKYILLGMSFCIIEMMLGDTMYSFDYFDMMLMLIMLMCESILISHKPMNALLALISGFFISMSLTFYYCEFTFLPLIILLLYMGAIAVLFLFTTMLFSHPETSIELYTFFEKMIWMSIYLSIWTMTYMSMSQIFEITDEHRNLMSEFNSALDINSIADSLYSSESSLFLILSILLLAVLMATGLITRPCPMMSNVLLLLIITPTNFKETVNIFCNCWPMDQWMYSLLGLIMLYLMLFFLYNYLAVILNKKYNFKLYMLPLKLSMGLLSLDIFLNIFMDIIIMYIHPNTILSKLILNCPMSLSPLILLAELIIMCMYSYIKYKKNA